MKRNATAVWNGTIKEGNGHLTTQSSVLNQTQYSFNSRFAEGVGTNPEELLAAAHAGCFTMKLSWISPRQVIPPKDWRQNPSLPWIMERSHSPNCYLMQK